MPAPAPPSRLRAVQLIVLMLVAVGCGGDDPPADASSEGLADALAAHAEGRVDEAAEGYQAVLEDEPANQYALYNLGLLDQAAGRDDEAEERYRAAIEADPSFAPALFNLAILRTGVDPEEAEQLYRSTTELEPGNANAHLNLGFLLVDQGDREAGEAELGVAVALDPSLADRVPDDLDVAPADLSGPTTTTP